MLRFFKFPDPAFPYTMTRENIVNAQNMGVLHNGFAMYIAANLQMFGEDSGSGLATLPADEIKVNIVSHLEGREAQFVPFGKYWADRFNVPERYVYFDRGESPFLSGKIRAVTIKATNTEAGGFSDPSFEIYNPRCAQFYREFAELIMAWGGVPALRVYQNELGEGTKRLYFPKDDAGNVLPSLAIPLKLLPGDGTGLGELVFRFDPIDGSVDYFSPQEFFQAIREGKFNVKEEIERALRLRAPRTEGHRIPDTEGFPIAYGDHATGGSHTIIPASPVTVTAPPAPPTAPPASDAISHWEGLEINNSTGEAIVNGLQTGLFFERPAQILPQVGGNPDVDRAVTMISPLSYATKYTADEILKRLQEAMPGWKFVTLMGDPNKMFPVSVLARYVGVKLEDGAVIPASNIGLIAQTIARTTAMVSDGRGGSKKVQDWSGAIETAVGEIRRAVDDYQAKLR